MKTCSHTKICSAISIVYQQGENLGTLSLAGFKANRELSIIQNFFKTEKQEAFILSAFAYRRIISDESLSMRDLISWLKIQGIVAAPEIFSTITRLVELNLISREISRWEKKEGQFILTESAYKSILTGNLKFIESIELVSFQGLLEKTMSL